MWSSHFVCALSVKKSPVVVHLVEGERDVISLDKVEEMMFASVNSLKHDYTTSVIARITPGR